jgi:hypothetical protein
MEMLRDLQVLNHRCQFNFRVHRIPLNVAEGARVRLRLRIEKENPSN